MLGPRALPISVDSREETGINLNKRINKMAINSPELDKFKNETAVLLEELARRIRIGECIATGYGIDTERVILFEDGPGKVKLERKLTIEYLDFSGRAP